MESWDRNRRGNLREEGARRWTDSLRDVGEDSKVVWVGSDGCRATEAVGLGRNSEEGKVMGKVMGKADDRNQWR